MHIDVIAVSTFFNNSEIVMEKKLDSVNTGFAANKLSLDITK